MSLTALGIQTAALTPNVCLEDWWIEASWPMPKKVRKCFDSVVTLIAWSLWKQRNGRDFHNLEQQRSASALVAHIITELHDSKEAGAVCLDTFARV